MGVYFRSARLLKDGKTGQRLWRFKWAITLSDGDAYAAGGAIQSTFEHLQARENSAEKIELSGCVGSMTALVFDLSDADAPTVLRLQDCFIEKFSMTWSEGMTEFWITLEHELTNELHAFVKNFAFQRFWVEFKPAQMSLEDVLSSTLMAEGLQELSDDHSVSTSLEIKGKKIAEFKPGRIQ